MGGVILTSKGGEANTRYRWKETVLTTAASAVQVFSFFFFLRRDEPVYHHTGKKNVGLTGNSDWNM